jgi:hypothetical protein
MRGWVTAPYACGPHLAVRRASCAKTRSPFGAPPRLSPKPCGLGSVRSRASWSRTTDPRPGQLAPSRPASWPAGRVSEPPRDEVTSPVPGTAPARINRPSPVGVPSNERDGAYMSHISTKWKRQKSQIVANHDSVCGPCHPSLRSYSSTALSSTWAPAAHSVKLVDSASLCEMPPAQGTKIMVVGATRAM